MAGLRRRGAVPRLVVSHAFHSALLEPMLDALEAAAETVEHRAAQLGLMSNLSGDGCLRLAKQPDAAYWRAMRGRRCAMRRGGGVVGTGRGSAAGAGPRPVLGPLALGAGRRRRLPVRSADAVAAAGGRRRAGADRGGRRDCYAAGAPIDLSAREADEGVGGSRCRRIRSSGCGTGSRRRVAPRVRPVIRCSGWRTARRAGRPGGRRTLSAGEPGWTADHTLFWHGVAPGALHACLAAASEGKFPVGGTVRARSTRRWCWAKRRLRCSCWWRRRMARACAAGGCSAVPPMRRAMRRGDCLPAANWRRRGRRHASAALPALVERNVEEFYAAVAALGIGYGPSFSGIERLWSGAGAARGAIAAPEGWWADRCIRRCWTPACR